jgi:hypothetical protein
VLLSAGHFSQLIALFMLIFVYYETGKQILSSYFVLNMKYIQGYRLLNAVS